MKRLWIALALMVLVSGLCTVSHIYQHRQMDRMLAMLDRLEQAYDEKNMNDAHTLAKQLAKEYDTVGRVLYCFVAHGDMAESQETVALLPALLRQGGEEELRMEIARLREQFEYLRTLDDPLIWNIL